MEAHAPSFSRIKHLCLMAGIHLTFKMEVRENGKGWNYIPVFKDYWNRGEFFPVGENSPRTPEEVTQLFQKGDLVFNNTEYPSCRKYTDGKFEDSLSIGNA